ncbi:MAG: hypothetical protein AAGF15_00840 [Pseudomonadota bacterium]
MRKAEFPAQVQDPFADGEISAAAQSGKSETPVKPGDPNALNSGRLSRHRLPFLAAGLFTVFWLIGLAATGFLIPDRIFSAEPMTASTVTLFMTGALMPVLLAWMIALVAQRTDPLLERRLAVQRGLDRALAPIDAAEQRLADITAKLKRELVTVEKTADLAEERIRHLEDRFQSQISDLFSTTTDAEAKAASLCDLIRREREKMSSVAETLKSDGDALSVQVLDLTSRINDASTRTQALVTESTAKLGATREEIADTGEKTRAVVIDAQARLSDENERLAAIGASAEEKLYNAGTQLAADVASWRTRLESLCSFAKASGSEFTAQLQTLEALFQATNKQAQQTTSNFEDQANAIVANADIAQASVQAATDTYQNRAQEISVVVEGTTRQLQNETDRLYDVLQAAHLNTHAAIGETRLVMDEQRETLLSETRNLAEDLLVRVNQALDDLHARADVVEQKATSQTEQLANRFDTMNSQLETHTQAIGQTLTELETWQNRQQERMAENGGRILEDIDTASAHFDQNVERLIAHMTEHVQGLAQLIETGVETSAKARDQFTQHQNAMINVSTPAAQTVRAAGSEIQKQTTALKGEEERTLEALNRVQEVSQSVSERVETLDQQARRLSARFETLDDTSKSQLAEITSQRDALAAAQQDLSERLEQTSASMTETLSAMLKDLNEVADISDRSEPRISSLSETLKSQVHEIENAVEFAETQAKTGAINIGGIYLETMARARRLTTETLDAANEATRASLATVEESLAQTRRRGEQALADQLVSERKEIERVSEMIESRIGNALSGINRAIKQTQIHAESAHRRIAKEAEALLTSHDAITESFEQFETRLDSRIGQSLAETAAQLIENLSSESVDIARALSKDVSDGEWEQYLAGDRSYFTRKAVRLLSKSEDKRVRRRYESDPEFKETALAFLRDFEALLSRATVGSAPSGLSVALLSSEVGRLYTSLASALHPGH